MADKYLLGVDIGTQGAKASLFTVGGQCLAAAFRKSRLYQPSPGVVEEDPEWQLTTACQAVKECVKNSKVDSSDIAAVGIDGQMAGIIGIGKDGKNVTPYDSWLDTRCAPYIQKMENEAGGEILDKTGNAPSFNHGPKKLWWMHECKKTFRQIHAFVQPGAYVAMRLCGLDAQNAFIDRTYLHFSGFADNQRNCWDADLCQQFNLDIAMLPQIVEPQQIIGQITASMACRCALKANLPVVAGCGDTAASFLACGATRPGVCIDVAGTASVFAATTDAFQPDKNHRILGCGQAVIPGLWHPYAYINGGGMNLEWFRKEIANNHRTPAKNQLTFEHLNKLAQKLPDDQPGPLFIPHFAGRVCPSQPNLRGAWVGLSWDHTLAHLYRAVLEGVALEYGLYRNVLTQLYPQLKLKEIRVTGGGERSTLWNQIKAATLKIPVVQIANNQGAPMGAAILAGLGVGLFKNLNKTINQWVKTDQRFLANAKMKKFYQNRLTQYEKLLHNLNNFHDTTQATR